MLKAVQLRKQFFTVLAVDNVSLEVRRGGIFGLIGPNGAGKSTTIRMLLNIIKPDSGLITYEGQPFSDGIRNRIGYLPEERGLYKKNGLLDTIVYFASLRGVSSADAKKKAIAWLDRFNLLTYAKRKVEELSKGNQQKAQFITTILHDPDLIILDEPFSGLDPVNQIVMKDIFAELKQQGKAIVFSTHQMETAEKLCDEICLINRGAIVLEGTVKQAKQRFGANALHLEFDGDGKFLSSLPFVRTATIYENYAELTLAGTVSSNDILQAVMPKVDLRKFEFVEPSLNSIFLQVVGTSVEEVEKEKIEHASAGTIPAIKNPEVKKQTVSIIIGLLVTLIGLILLAAGKDSGMLAGIGGAVSVLSFFRLQKVKERLRKEKMN
ncbi:MAG: ATP-binding cassette domain-containing protein [Bacteriovoracaceae bacterium]|nr:ATP-binding cassette domain-containing protein [Bacteroidota bacterium]